MCLRFVNWYEFRKSLGTPLSKSLEDIISVRALKEPDLVAKAVSMVRMFLFYVVHVHINGV